MVLGHSRPGSPEEVLAAALEITPLVMVIEPSPCNVCNEIMGDSQDCLVIKDCSHGFHRLCIENYLSDKSECPVCKQKCELSGLRKLTIHSEPDTLNIFQRETRSQARGGRGAKSSSRGRGGLIDPFSMRKNQSICQSSPAKSQPVTNNNSFNPTVTSNEQLIHTAFSQKRPQSVTNEYSLPTYPTSPSVRVDKHVINSQASITLQDPITNPGVITEDYFRRVIENSLTRILGNMFNGTSQSTFQGIAPDMGDAGTNPPILRPQPHSRENINAHEQNLGQGSQNLSLNSDKITSIIRNWNIKFDGTGNGLTVEEFLYRIRILTRDNFNSNFDVVCKNLHILLADKALNWYWRYHKQVHHIQWLDFCDAIQSQFRDCRSVADIEEDLRNRKQRAGENFDAFYDSVTSMLDRLPRPIPERELVDLLMRNLRPEVRQDLLYVSVHSINHLRQLVQKREHFLNDDYVRKTLFLRNSNTSIPRRQISEIEGAPKTEEESVGSEVDVSIEAVYASPLTKCWNCDQPGHRWPDCLGHRTIFCYGCGAKNTYKPNCIKCTNKNSKN